MKKKQKKDNKTALSRYPNILISILIVIISVNFLLAPIILAQAQSDVYNPNTDILVSDYTAAQNNPQACSSFAQKVERATSTTLDFYTAIWDDKIWSQLYPGEKCFIVQRPRGYDGSDPQSLSVNNPGPVGSGGGIIAGDQVPAQDPDKSKWTHAREITAKLLLVATSPDAIGTFLTLFPKVGTVIKNTAEAPFVMLVNGFGGGIMSLSSMMLKAMTATITNLTSLTYEDAQGNPSKFPSLVLAGWIVVRDIMNLFFIIALIVISLATILRIETYSWKRLLPRLIIMALLVNFSKAIATGIVSVSDLLLMFFTTNDSGLIKPGQLLQEMYGGSKYFEGFFSGDILAVAIMKLILACVSLVSFSALTILFLIRLVGIWILIIFSPVAFALNILPATQQYSKMWWSYFIKYLIWAPVALFLLMLFSELVRNDYYGLGGDSTLRFLVMIVFVWGAVTVARQAGMVGSEMVINGAKAVGFGAPKWLVKQGLGTADRWLAKGSKSNSGFRKGLSYLSLGAWSAGYEKYKKEEERRAFGITGARRADTLYRRLPWQREKTSFGLEAHQDEVLHRAKEKMDLNMSEREMVEEMLHAKDPIDKQGWGMAIAGLNRQDDFTRILKEKMDAGQLGGLSIAKGFTNPLTGQTERLEDILKTGRITPENFQKLFYGMYLADLSEEEKLNYASMIQEYGEKQNKPYHLADNIEIETTDAQGRRKVERRVNYGYADLRPVASELIEKAKTRELNSDEKKKLDYYHAVVGQYRGRMNRTPANRFLNSMRAADIDVQFSDAESAKAAGFEGETYGDIHNTGMIIQEGFGLPHAMQLKNRQHELQARGVIPFGAKGEDVASDEVTLRRAVSSAAVNPVVMDVFLRDRDSAIKAEIFNRAITRARELNLPQNIDKLKELAGKYSSQPSQAKEGSQGPVIYGPDPHKQRRARTVVQQTINEIIRESSVKSEHHETLKNTITQAHSGDIDFSQVESRLNGLELSADRVAKSINKIKDSISNAKVQSADQKIFESIPAVKPETIKQATKQGIIEGLNSGFKIGMPQMLASISNSIKKVSPDTPGVDQLVNNIVQEVNKGT
ncbi:MAG: hypothetical protein Q8P83_00765 [bacterium]|nr:hypothetical protein [bacterium]